MRAGQRRRKSQEGGSLLVRSLGGILWKVFLWRVKGLTSLPSHISFSEANSPPLLDCTCSWDEAPPFLLPQIRGHWRRRAVHPHSCSQRRRRGCGIGGPCPVPASNIPMVVEWEPSEGGTSQDHSHLMNIF